MTAEEAVVLGFFVATAILFTMPFLVVRFGDPDSTFWEDGGPYA